MVDKLLLGIRSTDQSIASAKVNVYQNYRANFNGAVEFLSGLISSVHAAAQLDYASRHSGHKRRYVSAMGANDQRGGRGRARLGAGRGGQQRGGRGSYDRGRDGRGRGRGNERRTYANNVDITDPHRNFTAEEWERLGSMRSYVLQLREGGRGGRGRGDRGTNASRPSNSVSAAATSPSEVPTSTTNGQADQSIVSDISERGSQNGRSFGRGAYNA